MKFLNGWKTRIGALLGLVTVLFVFFTGQAVDGVDSPDTMAGLLTYALAALTVIFSGSGLFHKILKWSDDVRAKYAAIQKFKNSDLFKKVISAVENIQPNNKGGPDAETASVDSQADFNNGQAVS